MKFNKSVVIPSNIVECNEADNEWLGLHLSQHINFALHRSIPIFKLKVNKNIAPLNSLGASIYECKVIA
jgi:hypothetical protein